MKMIYLILTLFAILNGCILTYFFAPKFMSKSLMSIAKHIAKTAHYVDPWTAMEEQNHRIRFKGTMKYEGDDTGDVLINKTMVDQLSIYGAKNVYIRYSTIAPYANLRAFNITVDGDTRIHESARFYYNDVVQDAHGGGGKK